MLWVDIWLTACFFRMMGVNFKKRDFLFLCFISKKEVEFINFINSEIKRKMTLWFGWEKCTRNYKLQTTIFLEFAMRFFCFTNNQLKVANDKISLPTTTQIASWYCDWSDEKGRWKTNKWVENYKRQNLQTFSSTNHKKQRVIP